MVSEQSKGGDGSGADRSPAQIEADIDEARKRLAGTVDEIAERVKPANVVNRGKESAKAQVLDPSGGLRTGRVAVMGAVVAVYVALKVWRFKRHSSGGSRRR